MKLLYCRVLTCGDIVRLSCTERTCTCGRTKGRYLSDGIHAVYSGDYAVPLGIANESLEAAIAAQPEQGEGKEFTAFVIPKDCPTFHKED
jgi:hypothetical protein